MLKVCIGITKTKFVKLFIADLSKDASDSKPKNATKHLGATKTLCANLVKVI